jgi:hypothetical protein
VVDSFDDTSAVLNLRVLLQENYLKEKGRMHMRSELKDAQRNCGRQDD